jgi:sugar diacid utilization regulator
MASIDFCHNNGDIIEVNDREAVKRYVEQLHLHTNALMTCKFRSRRSEPMTGAQFKEVFARYGLQLGHLGISLRI